VAIRLNAENRIGDVTGGDERGDACFRAGFHKLGFIRRDKVEPQLHFEAGPGPLALQLRDGLLKKLAIKIEPNRHDVSALGGAENAAGAADLEVAHRDPESGA
jgi:hypothetical protein